MHDAAADSTIRRALDEIDAEYQQTEPGHYLVRLPGEHRLATMCWLIAAEQALRIEAFVLRAPVAADGDIAALHRELLRRNARLFGICYSIDRVGDIFLTGRWPLSALGTEEIDRLLGLVLAEADGAFDELLRIGYADAIRREFRWRRARGESLANLRRFESITGPPGPLPAPESPG
ncbi:MAG: YbjN domain-containing protein [Mycobacteriales bacterium]